MATLVIKSLGRIIHTASKYSKSSMSVGPATK